MKLDVNKLDKHRFHLTYLNSLVKDFTFELEVNLNGCKYIHTNDNGYIRINPIGDKWRVQVGKKTFLDLDAKIYDELTLAGEYIRRIYDQNPIPKNH